MTLAQQRKGTFQPSIVEQAHIPKMVSVLEVQPATSILSNRNTEESSAYPKKDDQGNDSYQSRRKNNLPMFAENALDAKASGQGNFFDLAQFGQKPRRSSTDPKMLHQQSADMDETRLTDAQLAVGRGVTQTITDSNASASIKLQYLDQEPGDHISLMKEAKPRPDYSRQAANTEDRKRSTSPGL